MRCERHPTLLLILMLMCVSGFGCSDDTSVACDGNVDNTDFVAEESFHFRVDIAGQTELRLYGVSGDITIEAEAASDSLIISGQRRVRSESIEDAEEHLELLTVSVEDSPSRVIVKTEQPSEAHGRAYEVDYDVALPQGLVLDIENVNGRIVLDNILGDAFVQLVNGQIDAEVALPEGGTIGMNVVNGSIELTIPEATSAEFSASVVNGSISMYGLVLQNLVSTSTSLSGTLGSGDGAISLNVVNGTISVVGVD